MKITYFISTLPRHRFSFLLFMGLLLFLTLTGCSPNTLSQQANKIRYKIHKSNIPCVYVCWVGEPQKSPLSEHETNEHYVFFELDTFLLSSRTFDGTKKIIIDSHETNSSFELSLRLFKNEPDISQKGNILMDWEIEYHGTAYPVNNVSWNQKDILPLWSGDNCAVFLSLKRTSRWTD